MPVTFALPELVKRVRERLAADALAAGTAAIPVEFGWEARYLSRSTTHRIVFVPGDDSSGTLGATSGADSPYVGLARPLAALDEQWTCYLEAEDLSDESEVAQYTAARMLYDAWYRAVYLARSENGRIPVTILSQRWIADRTHRDAGAALRVTGTVSAAILDTPTTIAPVDTGAALTVAQLDVEETLTIDPPEED